MYSEKMYFECRGSFPDIDAHETGILNVDVIGVIPNTRSRRLGSSRHGLFGIVEPVDGRQTPHLAHDIDFDRLSIGIGLPDFMPLAPGHRSYSSDQVEVAMR